MSLEVSKTNRECPLVSPETTVSALLKNVKAPEFVLLFRSEVITKELKNRYNNLKKHIAKK